jgi:amino acid transporter
MPLRRQPEPQQPAETERPRTFIRIKRQKSPSPKGDAPRDQPRAESGRSTPAPGEGEPSGASDLHTRIVIPRQARTGSGESAGDVELREVRYGTTSRGPYLRVVRGRETFIKSAPGHLEATALGSRPTGGLARIEARVKRLVLGSPFSTSRLIHERLTKVRALGVFSSDPLSSAAYSAEEIMIVLLLAGTGALYLTLPITAALLALLWTVRLSYIQTIKAYPNGGGAYIVAHENLGVTPALVAAAALLVDYVLTVSVSIAAGVAAITSAAPALYDLRVPLALLAVALITWGNLRGIRESGAIFGLPTYFFIVTFSMMIIVGFIKLAIGHAPGTLLHSAPPTQPVLAVSGLSVFLVLRAFSSGAAAVTGIEAISNGVPAFKPPESRNAQITMQWEAAFLGFFLLGVAFLATRFGIVPSHDETLVSILGREVLGKNVLYYAYQVGTAGVLLLAANTAYADFPRLSAILARDRFAPRQLWYRGDRLAFSNGIMLLGAAAAVLLVMFQAEVTRLIPLYILGVFISMTISQSGMIRHWLRLRERGWRMSLFFNGIGAVATGVVVVIVGATKFTEGAWISVIAMLVLFTIFTLIRRHYDWFAARIRVDDSAVPTGVPAAVPVEPGGPRDHVIVPVDSVNKISLGAIGMARAVSSHVTAVHLTDDKEDAERFREEWSGAVPDVPLIVIESPYRAFVAPMLAFVESLERAEPNRRIVVVLPSFVVRHWWERLLHNRDVLRLKPHLRKRPSVRVLDFPYRLQDAPA